MEATASFISRFIDPNTRFKFVSPKGYKLLAAEIRFDMFEAESTHGVTVPLAILDKAGAVGIYSL